ncbi:MAG: methenyltetrahydromethanopterin cyclohydrolase [Candidatus Odinarchaeota archaeon]
MANETQPSVNKLAMHKMMRLISESDLLRVKVHKTKGKATLIDCGIDVPGSLEAGRLVAEVCMGGLGTVELDTTSIGNSTFPAARVTSDNAPLACIGSQAAGWNVKVEGFFALGSGPARARAQVETKLYDKLNYKDKHKEAILILETRTLPNPAVCEYVAEACNIEEKDLYLLVAPTASIVGSVQIAARIVETGIHKLKILGYDFRKVLSGIGLCPIVPVARKDMRAMGITNDAILMMGETFLFIQSTEDDDLADLIGQVPSSTSSDYGKPFHQIFKDAEGDFYKIDKMLFAPAHITINDLRTGRYHTAGHLDPQLFLEALASTLK